MAWKKSNDGGIDYEVEEHIKHQKQEPESFSAMTMTFNMNVEEVEFERPLTAREKIERFKTRYRRERGLV